MTSRPTSAGARSSTVVLAARILLIACVVTVAVIVLWPGPPAADAQHALRDFLARAHRGWLPRWVSFGLIEWSSNVLMFLPIGFLGALAVRPSRRWWVVPAAAVASVVIEFTQQALLPARTASLADVLANTLGALIGVALVRLPVVRRWTP